MRVLRSNASKYTCNSQGMCANRSSHQSAELNCAPRTSTHTDEAARKYGATRRLGLYVEAVVFILPRRAVRDVIAEDVAVDDLHRLPIAGDGDDDDDDVALLCSHLVIMSRNAAAILRAVKVCRCQCIIIINNASSFFVMNASVLLLSLNRMV